MMTRIPHDYHTHTNASCDSEATMDQMCQRALEVGIGEIAFTEHFDLHPKEHCLGYYDPGRYFETVEAAREQFEPQRLTIRAGIELGEYHIYHAEQQRALDCYPYDVVLGSLHWVEQDSMFDRAHFRSHPARDTIEPYFTELLRMVEFGGFDVLAHVDVFKRVAQPVYGGYDITEYEDFVRPVWQACIDRGIAPEINTAALRRGLPDPHPALEALRWYKAMGGERLTIGSDGHRPRDLGYALDTALNLARAAGFTQLCQFARRQVVGWLVI